MNNKYNNNRLSSNNNSNKYLCNNSKEDGHLNDKHLIRLVIIMLNQIVILVQVQVQSIA